MCIKILNSPLTKVCIIRAEEKVMRVNVYIREEDEDLWAALDNKSEWIHQQLNKDQTIKTEELDTWQLGNEDSTLKS